jgi:hypothetical protein
MVLGDKSSEFLTLLNESLPSFGFFTFGGRFAILNPLPLASLSALKVILKSSTCSLSFS